MKKVMCWFSEEGALLQSYEPQMIFCRLITVRVGLKFRMTANLLYLQYMEIPRKSKDVEDRSTYRVQCNSNSNNVIIAGRSPESSTAAWIASFSADLAADHYIVLSIGQTITQDNSYPVIVIAFFSGVYNSMPDNGGITKGIIHLVARSRDTKQFLFIRVFIRLKLPEFVFDCCEYNRFALWLTNSFSGKHFIL